jgi:phosphonate transport system substrate-binding protein
MSEMNERNKHMKMALGMMAAMLGLAFAGVAQADCIGGAKKPAWAAEAPEARFGFTTPETSSEARTGFTQFTDYMCRKLGVPAKVFNASDYNGVAQAIFANQIDVALVGPSNYAMMWAQTKGGVEPILTNVEIDGSKGYYSVLFVKASSTFRKLSDLKGKTLAYADVNSTSGYLFPRHAMRAEGLNPDTFFGKPLFAGGHDQGVIAVIKGQADAGVTWASGVGDPAEGYSRGILRRMAEQKLFDMKDLRIIWKAGPILNGPVVVRKALPQGFKDALVKALTDLPKENPQAFRAMVSGDGPGFAPVTHADYQVIIDMRKAEEAARRGGR